jgi:hypothetical protein
MTLSDDEEAPAAVHATTSSRSPFFALIAFFRLPMKLFMYCTSKVTLVRSLFPYGLMIERP